MEGYRCELDWAGYLDFLELLHFGYLGLFFILYFYLSLVSEIWSLDHSVPFLFLVLLARVLAI